MSEDKIPEELQRFADDIGVKFLLPNKSLPIKPPEDSEHAKLRKLRARKRHMAISSRKRNRR